MHNDTAWVDGAFVSAAGAALDLDTGALQFGLGASERIRVCRRTRGELIGFRVGDHLDRLFASCRLLELSPAGTKVALSEVCLELVRRAGYVPGQLNVMVLAALIGDGAEPAQLAPGTRSIIRFSEVSTSFAEQERAVLRATCSSVRSEVGGFLGASNVFGNRTSSWIAQRVAVRSGFDAALQLDNAGHVVGAAFADVGCVVGERVFVAPVPGGAFASVARETVTTLAAEAGYYVEERVLTRESLLQADEVFLVSTGLGVQAVGSIDHLAIRDGQPGPVTQRLRQRLEESAEGADSNHPEWLFLV